MAREFSKSFYKSKEWLMTRETVLKRDNYLCVKCGRPAEEVHHIIHLTPKNINDVAITMNPDNLASLCRDCHFKTHEEDWQERCEQGKARVRHNRITEENGTYFDEYGMLQCRQVYIVYGSPRSGKSTYVNEHKQFGDVVIDVDLIIFALQGNQERHKDNNLKYLAVDIRDFLFKQLEEKNKNFDCKNVWIIGGFPKKKEREELAERLKAKLIYIPSTQTETEARAIKDDLYNDKKYAADVVNYWWRKYEQ